MLFVPAVFALVALAGLSDGAALVRLINTVPSQARATSYADSRYYSIRSQPELDRVGLSYVNGDSTTIVWTQFMSGVVTGATPFNEGTTSTTNYAYSHAMPPLRRYQIRRGVDGAGAATTTLAATTDVLVSDDVDRVAIYKADQLTNFPFIPANPVKAADRHPLNWDPLSQDILKSDGVGLYLSFAAGTYQFQPYSVRGAAAVGATSTAFTTAAVQQKSGLTSVTFVDGKVYTLVIIGDGKWTVSAQAGSDFTIKVIEEVTTPTTFGKAALRWFHAIKPNRDTTISVLSGDGTATAGNTLVSNIAFGSVSSYVDVTPNTRTTFTITTPSTIVAPTTTAKLETTHDIRAGLRATIICARNSEDSTDYTFCRMIPSRVVAYVRFVNDLASAQQFHLGSSGMVPLNTTKLSVFASSEMPRADQIAEYSQTGAARTVLNHPLNIRGLYKILDSVAPGAASGYGEVFVPTLIMDFAITWTVVRDAVAATTVSSFLTYKQDSVTGLGVNENHNIANTQTPANYFDAATALQTYLGGVFHKRVHFVIKTEGGATVSPNLLNTAPSRGVSAAARWLAGSSTLDVPIEPGTYVTLALTVAPNAGSEATAVSTYMNGKLIVPLARLDRSVDDVASGVAFNKFQLFINPFMASTVASAACGATCTNLAATAIDAADRQRYSGTLTFTSKSRCATATNDLGASIGADAAAAWDRTSFIDLRRLTSHVVVTDDVNGPLNSAYTSTSALPSSLGAGAYAVTYAPAASATSATCYNSLPAFDVNGAAGDIISVYVMNTFACRNAVDFSKLKVLAVKTQSALVTGNDQGTILNPGSSTGTTSFLLSAAPSSSFSVVAIISALLVVLNFVF